MSKYRATLPQLEDRLFLTDGGLETGLVLHDGIDDPPRFAACDLMRSPQGRKRLAAYYERYIAIAADAGYGVILEAPTWRASPDWAAKLGYSAQDLAAVNRDSIALLEALRTKYESASLPIVVSGCVGPRGEGPGPVRPMSAEEARLYHAEQVAVLTEAGADMITAVGMTNAREAIGIVNAAEDAQMPVVISFTLETGGRLPSGETLGAAIDAVDEETTAAPVYYMIDCAHPAHLAGLLAEKGGWLQRLRGLHANASRRGHAAPGAAAEPDAGDPAELGRHCRELTRRHAQITVIGGGCGTDHRHVGEIAAACRQMA